MIEIDGYADVERIGQGGLGDVYRATRVSTGGTVAIKVLRDVSDESVAWHRTRRELTALVSLAGHGNVIQLLELLDLAEGPALVMEYAPGGSVAGLLHDRGATLSVGEVVLVGRHTARALVAAHEQGIVHRDLKPQNLLIDAYGQVKLCDFGVAALTTTDDFRTRTNALSMRYASPEDLDDEIEVGPPSDVYSLGATLLHLAHGAPPTLKERLAPWTPPATGDDELAGLDAILADCLHPDPTRRPTAADVLDRLERLDWTLAERHRALPTGDQSPSEPGGPADSPAVVAPPSDTTVQRPDRPTPPRPKPIDEPRSRRPWIVAGLIGITVVAAIAAFVWWPDHDPDDEEATTSATTTLATTTTTSTTTSPTTATPTTTLEVAVVARPSELPPIADAVWPFGDPGECLVQMAGETELQAIACTEPHDLQRFAVAELDTDRYPPDAPFAADELRTAVEDACRTAFEPFVGIAPDDSEFDAPFTLPSAATWADGDRRYQCLLGLAGARTIGDATGSER